MPEAPFTDVPTALREIAAGKMIVVVDDEDRENEGDLTLAAEFVTPEAINFMATHGRGLICLTLTEERADYLRLPPMASENTSRFGTAFTESIEAREGVTTGISAHDRAHTIRVAISPESTANDLARPGHVFPLRARKGGTLVRAGQTEASVDLARMAGLIPAGVICEIMNPDGTMARVPDLIEFCKKHDMLMLTVAELIRHRLQHERSIQRVATTTLPTEAGEFQMVVYENEADEAHSHVALTIGDLTANDEPMLVRVHSHCLTGETFGSSLCDCRQTVDDSLRAIAAAGRGALLYLHTTEPGFGLDRSNGIARVMLHRTSGKTEPACEERHHTRTLRASGVGAQILADLGLKRIRLLTNRPAHVPALQGFGIEIVEQVPVRPAEVAKR